MKPFHFQLESVLRLKRQMLNQTERKLARAAAEKQCIAGTIDQWKQEIEDTNRQVKAKSSGVADATWHHAMRRVVALEQRLVAGREQLEAATQAWQTVRSEYTRLASETETIQRMRATKWQSYLMEREAEEQRELDEVVLQRSGRREVASQRLADNRQRDPALVDERQEELREKERRVGSRS